MSCYVLSAQPCSSSMSSVPRWLLRWPRPFRWHRRRRQEESCLRRHQDEGWIGLVGLYHQWYKWENSWPNFSNWWITFSNNMLWLVNIVVWPPRFPSMDECGYNNAINHPWLGMVHMPTIYGDDWGMVYYCYTVIPLYPHYCWSCFSHILSSH